MKRIFHNLILYGTLAALLCTSCHKATEPESIDYHNKILFTSHRSGKDQLYIMNPDGGNIRQITSGQYWHDNGRWSPDAKQIVCNTGEGSTTAGTEMVVMNSDGSNRILLGWGYPMTWYPDGSIIVFSYWQGAEVGIYNNKLYSISPNGKNVTILSEIYVSAPTFSPDGKKIATGGIQDSLTRIVILDYPGFSNPVYIGPPREGDPAWSPDNTQIAFSSREISTESNDNIYIMNPDGSNARKITNNVSNMPYIYPRWSPDGEKIVFLAYTVDGTENWYLYMVNKDGTNLHKVIDDNSVTACDWSK